MTILKNTIAGFLHSSPGHPKTLHIFKLSLMPKQKYQTTEMLSSEVIAHDSVLGADSELRNSDRENLTTQMKAQH